jgi:uncharacterized protein YciI
LLVANAALGVIVTYMKTRFMVLQANGPSWDPTRLRRAQAQWDEHAAFMDKLTADGFIILGGPLGEGDGDDALLIVDAPDKEAINSRFKNDPWIKAGILEIKTIQRWTIFLEAKTE